MLEQYKKSILDSGARLVTEKIPTVRSVSLGVWVDAGGRDETLETQGLTHFLEHMIFKGTKNRSALEIALEIESLGGHINAFTGKEMTCFFVQMLDENIGTALEVLADIMANSLFRPEDMVKEKTVILEEIKNLEDSPDDLIYDYLISEVYPAHSLGYPILGTPDTVQSFTAEHLLNLIKNSYTSDKIVIAAAGNIEHDNLCELIEKHFSFIPGNPRNNSQKLPDFIPGRKVWERPISQAHICIGTRAFPYKDDRKFQLLVLNAILGGGMSSRLFQSIRETFGYAYSVYSFAESLSDTGMFGVYMGTDKNKIEPAADLVLKEFKRLCTEPLHSSELSRIKNQLKGNLMLGLESTSSRMNRLAKMEVYLQQFVTLEDLINNINQVSAEQVLEVANELFHDSRLFTVIFTPTEE
ncbi:insulinase family protein [bacterium]|nr:insulinase family protein [bacterium]